MTTKKRRLTLIGLVAFLVAAVFTTVIDHKADAANPPGHMKPGVHVVKVTKNTTVRFRVATNGYRVRGATHARAAALLSHRTMKFKKRMCVEFGKDSPHQAFPTINLMCDKHVKAVTNNLAECGGQGAIGGVAGALVGPVGAEIAAVAAFGGCEFSKTFQYFQRQQCPTKGNCAVRMAPHGSGKSRHQ